MKILNVVCAVIGLPILVWMICHMIMIERQRNDDAFNFREIKPNVYVIENENVIIKFEYVDAVSVGEQDYDRQWRRIVTVPIGMKGKKEEMKKNGDGTYVIGRHRCIVRFVQYGVKPRTENLNGYRLLVLTSTKDV